MASTFGLFSSLIVYDAPVAARGWDGWGVMMMLDYIMIGIELLVGITILCTGLVIGSKWLKGWIAYKNSTKHLSKIVSK